MKTRIIFFFFMILSLGVSAQYHVMERDIEVSPPVFTGVQQDIQPAQSISIEGYIADNIQYPKQDLKFRQEGTEVIQFTVKTDGSLSDFEVINSVSSEMDDEIIRILRTTDGMWKPGLNNDGPVAMQREVAVALKISEDGNPEHLTDFTEKARSYFMRGSKLLYTKNHPRRALSNLNTGIRFLPYDTNLLVMRGYARYALGDREGAIADWKIVKEKTDIDNLMFVAGIYNELDGYADLIEEVQ